MLLETIWFFFLFYSVHVSLFVYLFSFICKLLYGFIARIRITTVLRGYEYNYTETVPIGEANHHLFLLINSNDEIFPPLPKLDHIR